MNFIYANDIFNKKLNQNWMRVGILPYYIDKNSNIHVLLGIYKVSEKLFELCALSGGYKRTKENLFEGALREFNEETENYFIKYSAQIYEDLKECPILYSNGKNGIDRLLFMIDIKKYIFEQLLKFLSRLPTIFVRPAKFCRFRCRTREIISAKAAT